MASFRQMANSVGWLHGKKTEELHGLEEKTRELGIEPGADLAFAGVRVTLAQAADAVKALVRLAPHEADILALVAQREKAREQEPTSSGVS